MASIVHVKRTADLFEKDVLRGAGDHDLEGQSRPVVLPIAPLELRVILPRFSRPGTYQIAICRERRADSVLIKAIGRAVADRPREIVTVMLDLSELRKGSYWLSTRHDSDEASDYFAAQLQ